jgi:hypothetical protein
MLVQAPVALPFERCEPLRAAYAVDLRPATSKAARSAHVFNSAVATINAVVEANMNANNVPVNLGPEIEQDPLSTMGKPRSCNAEHSHSALR